MNKLLKRGLLMSVLLASLMSGFLLDGWLYKVKSNPLAQPSPPSSFYGNVTVNNQNITAGTILSAYISNTISATTMITLLGGISTYMIEVPGDNPGTLAIDGGRDGDEVIFKIPGYHAEQKGKWQFGVTTALTLTMLLDPTPIPPMTVTPTPPKKPITIAEPVTVTLFGTGITVLAAIHMLYRRKRYK